MRGRDWKGDRVGGRREMKEDRMESDRLIKRWKFRHSDRQCVNDGRKEESGRRRDPKKVRGRKC